MAVCPLIFFAHIFPKMACFCSLFWPPKLFTQAGQFFFTQIYLSYPWHFPTLTIQLLSLQFSTALLQFGPGMHKKAAVGRVWYAQIKPHQTLLLSYCIAQSLGMESVAFHFNQNWNGPPLAWADKLGLDRVFPLHHHCVLCLVQVELGNKSDSIVTQMLRQEIPKLPCLCFFIKYF